MTKDEDAKVVVLGDIIAALRTSRAAAIVDATKLRVALKDMFALVDEGKLVRDISHDHDPLWTLEVLKLVRRLKANKEAIE